MIPRIIIPVLLASFLVLITTFAVLMGGYGIAAAVSDAHGATVIWWVAMGCLMVLVIVCLLLLLALSIVHIDPAQYQRRRRPPHD